MVDLRQLGRNREEGTGIDCLVGREIAWSIRNFVSPLKLPRCQGMSTRSKVTCRKDVYYLDFKKLSLMQETNRAIETNAWHADM